MKKLQGGISQNGSIYYKNENRLAIYGWLYPRSSYDQISVYYNNKHIGNASLGIDRPDVFQHYPTEEGMKSGFKFSVTLDDFDTQDPVVFLVVKKGTEVITSLIENVTVYKYCNKFTECIERYKLLPNEKTDSFLFTRWIDSDGDAEYYRSGIYKGLFKRLEYTEKNGQKIVVSGENWYSLCAELEEKGYIPLKDFMPIWYYFFIKDSRIRFDVIVNELDDQKALEYIDFLKKIKGGGSIFIWKLSSEKIGRNSC